MQFFTQAVFASPRRRRPHLLPDSSGMARATTQCLSVRRHRKAPRGITTPEESRWKSFVFARRCHFKKQNAGLLFERCGFHLVFWFAYNLSGSVDIATHGDFFSRPPSLSVPRRDWSSVLFVSLCCHLLLLGLLGLDTSTVGCEILGWHQSCP